MKFINSTWPSSLRITVKWCRNAEITIEKKERKKPNQIDRNEMNKFECLSRRNVTKFENVRNALCEMAWCVVCSSVFFVVYVSSLDIVLWSGPSVCVVPRVHTAKTVRRSEPTRKPVSWARNALFVVAAAAVVVVLFVGHRQPKHQQPQNVLHFVLIIDSVLKFISFRCGIKMSLNVVYRPRNTSNVTITKLHALSSCQRFRIDFEYHSRIAKPFVSLVDLMNQLEIVHSRYDLIEFNLHNVASSRDPSAYIPSAHSTFHEENYHKS